MTITSSGACFGAADILVSPVTGALPALFIRAGGMVIAPHAGVHGEGCG